MPSAIKNRKPDGPPPLHRRTRTTPVIRTKIATGKESIELLADRYDVSPSAISE